MAARGNAATLGPLTLRWVLVPAIGWALASALSALRRRAREPSVARMSEEWLRSHDASAGRAPVV